MSDPLELVNVRLTPDRSISLADLAVGWSQHVLRIAAEATAAESSSAWGAHDYIAALSLRDLYERGSADVRTGPEIAVQRVRASDQLLSSVTELDTAGLVRRFADHRGPTRWWWDRIPISGVIRLELEGWRARIEGTAR